MRHQQLFRSVAHRNRVVHHQRAAAVGAVDVLQHVGGGDVGHVEGRVLAHQDHVHGRQVQDELVAELVVVAGDALHRHRTGAGEQPFLARRPRLQHAFAQRHVPHLVVPQPVAALLGGEHQREAGIAVDVDGLNRVHLDGDVQIAHLVASARSCCHMV